MSILFVDYREVHICTYPYYLNEIEEVYTHGGGGGGGGGGHTMVATLLSHSGAKNITLAWFYFEYLIWNKTDGLIEIWTAQK